MIWYRLYRSMKFKMTKLEKRFLSLMAVTVVMLITTSIYQNILLNSKFREEKNSVIKAERLKDFHQKRTSLLLQTGYEAVGTRMDSQNNDTHKGMRADEHKSILITSSTPVSGKPIPTKVNQTLKSNNQRKETSETSSRARESAEIILRSKTQLDSKQYQSNETNCLPVVRHHIPEVNLQGKVSKIYFLKVRRAFKSQFSFSLLILSVVAFSGVEFSKAGSNGKSKQQRGVTSPSCTYKGAS